MFGKKKEAPVQPIEAEIQETENTEESSGFTPITVTTIGQGITMVGDFDSHDVIEIKGTLKGNIRSDNNVYVGKDGSLLGDGVMTNLITEGCVDGNLECMEVAAITDAGSMKGTLSTKFLKTAPGANFSGKLTLKNDVPQNEPAAEAPAEQDPEEAPQPEEKPKKKKSKSST